MADDSTSLRGPDGLLRNVDYPRGLNGFVDWRAMLRPEHLYVNPDYETELKTRFNVKSRRDIDVTQCEDRQLLVLLDGWRYLLKMRGVQSIKVTMDHVSNEKAAATCTIKFIGNFETNGEPFEWSDVGSASLYSVSGSFQLHLEAMAANRALARCARAALGIRIYGKDEFDSEANGKFEDALKTGTNPLLAKEDTGAAIAEAVREAVSISPQDKLKEDCSKLGFSFDIIKERSAVSFAANPTEFTSDPQTWTDWDSIPRRDAYTLSVKVKNGKGKGKKKAE